MRKLFFLTFFTIIIFIGVFASVNLADAQCFPQGTACMANPTNCCIGLGLNCELDWLFLNMNCCETGGGYALGIACTCHSECASYYCLGVCTVDTVAPIISGVQAVSITANSATIEWATHEPADSRVNYGITTVLGSTEYYAVDVIGRSVLVSGLSPGTTYYYEVASIDDDGNTATDDNSGSYFTFTTASAGMILFKPPWVGVGEVKDIVDAIFDFIFWVTLIIVPLIVLVAAFIFVTAAGNSERVNTAKRLILYTAIGLGVIILSRALIGVIREIFGL